MAMSNRKITSKQCDKIHLQKKERSGPSSATHCGSMTRQNHSPSPDLFSHLRDEDNSSIRQSTSQGGRYQVTHGKELCRL